MARKTQDGPGRLQLWLTDTPETIPGLARRIGTHRSTVSRICSGNLRPTFVLALRLERETGLPFELWGYGPELRALVSDVAGRSTTKRKGV